MKKKLLTILLACVVSANFVACSSGEPEKTEEPTQTAVPEENETEDTSAPEETAPEEKIYAAGETWTVDGNWSLTINSITKTDQRNEYEERNPAQVLIVDYSYENLGLDTGVYFDFSMNQVVDSTGVMGYAYGGDIVNYPQSAPVGATCNAQCCIGVDNESTELKIIVSEYDNTSTNQTATFVVPIS